MKIICVDIDNTICTTQKNNYLESRPKKKIIKYLNNLYSSGYIIKLYTARGMGRSNDNKNIAEKKFKKLTIRQLKTWKLKYHKIFFGKPSADIYIDDKSLFYNSDWIKKLKKIV